MLTTPGAVTDPITALCNEICPSTLPLFIPIRPVTGIQDDCFGNVKRKMTEGGGTAQYGWAIYEWPSVMIEAVFHAAWRNPEDQLVDVTPPDDGATQTLFLPDPSRTYDGKLVDNRRMALTDDPLIHEFISVAQRQTEIWAADYRDPSFESAAAPTPVTAITSDEYHRLEDRKRFLLQQIHRKYGG